MKTIEVNCNFCKSPTLKTIAHYNKAVKRNQTLFFCSQVCFHNYKSLEKTTETNCATCQQPITRRLSEIKRIKNFFCSRSCATTHQHKNTPLKTKSIDCKRCGISVLLTRNQKGKLKFRSYCNTCAKLASNEKKGNNTTPWDLRTKAEIFNGSGNWQSARTSIRRHAVQVFLDSKKPKFCAICKYDTHTEICHIKSVSSFEGGVTLAEINSPTNLIALCPNHHWEYDNGLLDLKLEERD